MSLSQSNNNESTQKTIQEPVTYDGITKSKELPLFLFVEVGKKI